MARNPFTDNNKELLVAPASQMFLVVPDDNVDLPNGVCRGLLVGTAGAANIIDASGNACNSFPLQTGYNPIGATIIKSTGLLASNIWALY